MADEAPYPWRAREADDETSSRSLRTPPLEDDEYEDVIPVTGLAVRTIRKELQAEAVHIEPIEGSSKGDGITINAKAVFAEILDHVRDADKNVSTSQKGAATWQPSEVSSLERGGGDTYPLVKSLTKRDASQQPSDEAFTRSEVAGLGGTAREIPQTVVESAAEQVVEPETRPTISLKEPSTVLSTSKLQTAAIAPPESVVKHAQPAVADGTDGTQQQKMAVLPENVQATRRLGMTIAEKKQPFETPSEGPSQRTVERAQPLISKSTREPRKEEPERVADQSGGFSAEPQPAMVDAGPTATVEKPPSAMPPETPLERVAEHVRPISGNETGQTQSEEMMVPPEKVDGAPKAAIGMAEEKEPSDMPLQAPSQSFDERAQPHVGEERDGFGKKELTTKENQQLEMPSEVPSEVVAECYQSPEMPRSNAEETPLPAMRADEIVETPAAKKETAEIPPLSPKEAAPTGIIGRAAGFVLHPISSLLGGNEPSEGYEEESVEPYTAEEIPGHSPQDVQSLPEAQPVTPRRDSATQIDLRIAAETRLVDIARILLMKLYDTPTTPPSFADIARKIPENMVTIHEDVVSVTAPTNISFEEITEITVNNLMSSQYSKVIEDDGKQGVAGFVGEKEE